MIIHTGQVLKTEQWDKRRDTILHYMRRQIENSAHSRDLVIIGPEILEIVEMRFNGKEWVSAKGDNITHVKVTIEQEVEHA